jgi:hypothetical protein
VAAEKKDDVPMEDAPEDEQRAPVAMPPPTVVETVKDVNDESISHL